MIVWEKDLLDKVTIKEPCAGSFLSEGVVSPFITNVRMVGHAAGAFCFITHLTQFLCDCHSNRPCKDGRFSEALRKVNYQSPGTSPLVPGVRFRARRTIWSDN